MHFNTMLSSGRCTNGGEGLHFHIGFVVGRSRAQRFIPHWGNGRSRAQWEKNLTCLAFMSTFFSFRFSALPSTTGATYLQTLARSDPSTSPAVHTVNNCQRPLAEIDREDGSSSMEPEYNWSIAASAMMTSAASADDTKRTASL